MIRRGRLYGDQKKINNILFLFILKGSFRGFLEELLLYSYFNFKKLYIYITLKKNYGYHILRRKMATAFNLVNLFMLCEKKQRLTVSAY